MAPKGGRGGGGGSGGSNYGNSTYPAFSSTVTLPGSHFHDVVPMTTLVVSAICLLSFIAIIVWYAWVKGKNEETKKFLRWHMIGASILFMILYVLSHLI